jgi:hypothetical protein
MPYLSGQGSIYEAERDVSGNPLGFRFVGNVPRFEVALNVDTTKHKESTSGQRGTDLELITGKDAELTMTFQDFNKENMALMLYGLINAIVSGSITNEAFTNPVVVGSPYALKNTKVSALVITDSAGTPATLVAGTDYTADVDYGLVTFLNLGTYVQPFKAAYTKAAQSQVALFKAAQPERWVRFLGINTANANKRFAVDLYRVGFLPTAGLPFINDAVADFEVRASLLQDPTKPATGLLGQYGNVMFIDT